MSTIRPAEPMRALSVDDREHDKEKAYVEQDEHAVEANTKVIGHDDDQVGYAAYKAAQERMLEAVSLEVLLMSERDTSSGAFAVTNTADSRGEETRPPQDRLVDPAHLHFYTVSAVHGQKRFELWYDSFPHEKLTASAQRQRAAGSMSLTV
jgi:hypothetical protein